MEAASQPPQRPSRQPRMRADVACDHCRLKKLKCDTRMPSCDACRRHSKECIRTIGDHKPRPTRRRIETLEEENRRLRATMKAPQSFTVTRNSRIQDQQLLQDDPPEAAERSPPEDAPSLYHGPSSAIFDLHARDDNGDQVHRNTSDSHVASFLYAGAAKQRQLEPINFAAGTLDCDDVEPDLASHLLSIYWSRQIHTGLIIYRPVFMRDMACAGPYFSKLLLNAMYYSASKHSTRPEVRHDADDATTAGWRFRKRFRELLVNELDQSKIVTIQALLIMAVSLFSRCDERSTSWLYAGSAFNMIIDLGLHAGPLKGSPAQGKEEADEMAEISRRVFWGAYVLDKTQSLLQGRPPLLRISDASTPMLFLDNYEELEVFDSALFSAKWSHTGVPSRYMSSMRSLCELCSIMESIVTNLYGGSARTWDMASFNNKAEALHLELRKWRAHHWPLSSDRDTNKLPPLPHQLTIMALYSALVILLRRPLIIDVSQQSVTNPADGAAIAYDSFVNCHDAACEIVSVLDTYYENYPANSAPYLLSYATYIAATIFVRIPSFNNNSDGSDAGPLASCLAALDAHSRLYAAAKRTKSAIDVLTRRYGRSLDTVPFDSSVGQQQEISPSCSRPANDSSITEEAQSTAHSPPASFSWSQSESTDPCFPDLDRGILLRNFSTSGVDAEFSVGLESDSDTFRGLDLSLGVQHFDLDPFTGLFS